MNTNNAATTYADLCEKQDAFILSDRFPTSYLDITPDIINTLRKFTKAKIETKEREYEQIHQEGTGCATPNDV